MSETAASAFIFWLSDAVLDGFLVVEVLGHHLVGLKQHGGFVAGFGAGLLGQIAQLLNGAGLRALETVPLGIGILYGIALDLGRGAAIEVKRANADTGGNALALNRDHWENLLLQKRPRPPFGCGGRGRTKVGITDAR